jgi:hypothetical protein
MKTVAVSVALVLSAAVSWGYDWPAPDMQVVRTFGQRTDGAVLPGVEVQTLSPTLTAPENGDVLFVFRPDAQDVQNLPSALGGFVALAHDENLRTVTTRVSPEVAENKKSFKRGEPLGQAEVQVGASMTRHRLFVFDQQLGELVNPLLVFPAGPDTKAPLLLDVKAVAEGGQNQPVSLFGQGSLAVGYWNIAVDVLDPPLPGAGKEPRGVYGVEAYLNGSEVFNTSLDSLLDKNGRWQIKGSGLMLDDVQVQDQEWKLGQVFFNQGTNILEIVVKDFQGNQTGKTFRILGVR